MEAMTPIFNAQHDQLVYTPLPETISIVRGYAGESYDRRREGRNLSPYTLSTSSVRTLYAIKREKYYYFFLSLSFFFCI
jgi:hypothetical protein